MRAVRTPQQTRGTVYLTDGFERLDLPGKTTTFFLTDDWLIEGREVTWEWSYDSPGTVAGGFVVKSDGEIKRFDDVTPIVLDKGSKISVVPKIALSDWIGVEIAI